MRYRDNIHKDVYFHYVDSKINNEMFMSVFGHERCSSNKEPLGPMKRDLFLVHYILQGQGFLELEGKKHLLTRDDVFLIPPQTTYKYYQDPDDPWEYVWFMFGGLKAKTLCDAAQLTSEMPAYRCTDPGTRENLVSLLQAPANEVALELKSLSHLYAFFSNIIGERDLGDNARRTYREEIVKAAIQFIETRYADSELRLAEVSRSLHVNPNYLSRIFREIMGISPIRYIINTRLQHASALLESHRYSIKEVAYRVGYEDPNYFAREFRRHIGVSPKRYKAEDSLERNPELLAPDNL